MTSPEADAQDGKPESRYETIDRLVTSTAHLPAYFYVDRPAPPVEFVPPPGLDKTTQIPRYDWDLHDFNIEVEPVLQVLVGRNLEQARIELIEEEEEREFRRKRKAFEVARNAELMKTQRLDEEHRRMQEEAARRELQRRLYYENKKQTHQKLYSRVLAKSLLEGVEARALGALQDLSYFSDPLEDAVRSTFYDWLVDLTARDSRRHLQTCEGLERVAQVVPADWLELHAHTLDREQRRLQKIEDDRLESQRRFEEDRRQRRERRQQLRVQRSKRRLKEEIEAKVFSRRTNELDVLALKAVAYLDEEAEPKKFRTYGGFLYELWVVLSSCKKALAERTEVPPEKFLLDDDLKKLLLVLLADPNLKDKALRINFRAEHRPAFEELFDLMDKDLFAFNEQKEDLLAALAERTDLLHGEAFDPALTAEVLDPEILKALLRSIFRIHFKSNDYKVHEEPLPLPADPKDPAPQDPDPAAKPDAQPDGDLSGRPPPSVSHQDPAEPLATHESHTTVHRKAPEITEEDRRIEQLKKKLDLHFVEASEARPEFVAVLRVRETLNRDDLRPEVKAQREEEAERQRQEAEAVEDPKKSLAYHKKQYLLDEYLRQLKEEEDRRKQLEEEAEAQRLEQYIELYDGLAYERDLALHDIEDADRPPTNLNEALSLGPGREVLFVHRVNQRLLRRAFLDKLKECLKEMTLIKDVKPRAEVKALDDRLEQACLQKVVRSFDETPIFDVEI